MIEFIAQQRDGVILRQYDADGVIDVTALRAVSLNLNTSSVARYMRVGDGLKLVLVTGEEILLEGYYMPGMNSSTVNLFLSADGQITRVHAVEEMGSYNTLRYEEMGKFDDSEFVFYETPPIAAEEDDAYGFAPGLAVAGGFGSGAAALGGIAAIGVLTGDRGDDDDGTTGPAPSVTIDQTDDITVNSDTAGDGLQFTGEGTAGDQVAVIIDGETFTGTVGDDGTWSIQIPPADLPADGTYDIDFSVTGGDGQVTQVDGPDLLVDRIAPEFSTPTSTLSVAENSGASQVVHTVTVTDSDGVTYSIDPASADAAMFQINSSTGELTFVPNPDYEVKTSYEISVIATDGAGNTTPQTITVNIGNVPEVIDVSVEAQGAQNGILSTGDTINVTVRFDDQVNVDTTSGVPTFTIEVGGETRTAQYVSGAGTQDLVFSYTIQAGDTDATGVQFPQNGFNTNGAVVSGVGFNLTAEVTHGAHVPDAPFTVDTAAPNVTIGGNFSSQNSTAVSLSIDDLQNPIVVTGTAEPNSTVHVTLGGVTLQVDNIDSSGNWSVSFAADDLNLVDSTGRVSATATDAAGNTAEVFGRQVNVDTTPPHEPVISDLLSKQQSNEVFGIELTEGAGTTITFAEITQGGTVEAVAAQQSMRGYEFNRDISDGSRLVVTTTEDGSHNEFSTVMTWQDGSNLTGHDAGFDQFEIGAIDLLSADNSSLVITESEVIALAEGTDDLFVRGDNDNTVTVVGARATGETESIGGTVYDVYDFAGSSARIFIDTAIDDVNLPSA